MNMPKKDGAFSSPDWLVSSADQRLSQLINRSIDGTISDNERTELSTLEKETMKREDCVEEIMEAVTKAVVDIHKSRYKLYEQLDVGPDRDEQVEKMKRAAMKAMRWARFKCFRKFRKSGETVTREECFREKKNVAIEAWFKYAPNEGVWVIPNAWIPVIFLLLVIGFVCFITKVIPMMLGG